MIVIIPARYASTRLPGKPLADIHGKPMIQHVYARAQESGAARVVVATDDKRIEEAVKAFGGETCMTGDHHQSGTDRIAEVIERLALNDQEVIVNLQGDEPLMPVALIRQVAATLSSHAGAVMASACHAITDAQDFTSPHVVKVVCDHYGYALYFSRAPIPWPRAAQPQVSADRHIGIYAYRAGFVKRYSRWPVCPLESLESLEQLRVLWNGEKIALTRAEQAPPAGVDTPEDLARVRAILGKALK